MTRCPCISGIDRKNSPAPGGKKEDADMYTWKKLFVCGCCIFLSSSLLSAKTFYIDPASGKLSNDGSSASPWRTLQEVIDSGKIETREGASYPYTWGNPLKAKNAGAPVKAGDTLLLKSGYHGDILIQRAYNADYITVAAVPGKTPTARHVRLTSVCKWRIGGLTISPELSPKYDNGTLVFVESSNYSGESRDIVIENCSLYSIKDATKWTMGQWDTLSCDGIMVNSKKVIVRNNTLTNVNFGISISGDSCLVEKDSVVNFAGDGLRGLGDDDEFYNNFVTGCYAVNANHDDGFQSWSVGANGTVGTGVVKRMKLIGNTIINYTNPNQPFRGTLQGIGCFDGMFEDWVIENNIIMVDHWHGISLYGAKNCHIVNNTVCDLNTVDPGPPWIMITAHKDGTKSTGCVIRNNLSTAVTNDGDATCIADHNIVLKNPDDFFLDYKNFNLHLKAGCTAIDSGSSTLAPSTDISGTQRPLGKAVDIGAYEYNPAGPGAARMPYSAKSGTITRRIFVSHGGPVRFSDLENITVFDQSGKRVKTLSEDRLWNLTNDRRQMVRAGTYLFSAMTAQNKKVNGRVLIMK
jgi:parallel beta-helix repeat protein